MILSLALMIESTLTDALFEDECIILFVHSLLGFLCMIYLEELFTAWRQTTHLPPCQTMGSSGVLRLNHLHEWSSLSGQAKFGE